MLFDATDTMHIYSLNNFIVGTPPTTQRGARPQTMGRLLDRMTRSMGKRLPITVVEGKKRPEKPVQAAKLASEGGVAIRQGIPILTHWKDYKKTNSVLDNFMGTLGVSSFTLIL